MFRSMFNAFEATATWRFTNFVLYCIVSVNQSIYFITHTGKLDKIYRRAHRSFWQLELAALDHVDFVFRVGVSNYGSISELFWATRAEDWMHELTSPNRVHTTLSSLKARLVKSL